MALPPTFTARVNTSVRPNAQRQVAPGATSGIARGLTTLGREGSRLVAEREEAERQIAESEFRIKERELARNRQAAAVGIAARFSEQQVEFSVRAAELEQTAKPGGEGHIRAVDEELSRRRAAFMAQVPDDDDLLQKAGEQWTQFEGRARLRAETFEAGQRVERQVEDAAIAIRNAENLIAATPTIETWTEQMGALDGMVELLDISGNNKITLRAEMQAKGASALLTGMIDQGKHAEAGALLASGEFNTVLDRKTQDTLRRFAANAAALEAREAEMAAERQREAVKAEYDRVQALIKAGATDVGAKTLANLSAAMEAAGFAPADLVDVGALQIQQDINRKYPDARSLGAEIRRYEALERTGKLDPPGQIALRHMRDRRGDLLEKQGQEYRAEYDQGGNARQVAVNRMYDLPLDERVEAAAAVDKSGKLGRYVQMPKGAALLAVAGVEARKANKDLVPSDAASKSAQTRIFNSVTAGVLDDFRESERAAIMEAARDLYAGMAERANYDSFNEDRFNEAVQMALGRSQGKGGVVTWHGKGVLLPGWMTGAELNRALNVVDYANAQEPKARVLRHYTPVFTGEDDNRAYFEFRDASGAVLYNKSGAPYRVQIPRRSAN